MEAWRKELYHHGILGQKWGVRNGPPYPLDESQYSGKEKRIAQRANQEVGAYMQDETDRHARTVYKERYGDKNVGSAEYYQKLNSLRNEFMESPEYRELMSMKYSEVLNREQQIQNEGEKKTKIALGIIGAGLLVGGAIKFGAKAWAGKEIYKINAEYRDKEKERRHEYKLAYGPKKD